MRAALAPLNTPTPITNKHRGIIIVMPVGESRVKRSKEAKRLFGVHAPQWRHETQFRRERPPQLVKVMLAQAVHVQEKRGGRRDHPWISVSWGVISGKARSPSAARGRVSRRPLSRYLLLAAD